MKTLTLFLLTPLLAASAANLPLPAADEARGLIVVAGAKPDHAQQLLDFVKVSPAILLALAEDRSVLEDTIREGGAIGQITVVDGERIPIGDAMASVVIDAGSQLPEAELSRVLRPFGRLIHGGKTSIKPRPEAMDDWAYFHHDAANSEHSRDTAVAEPRGLQWIAGPTNRQDFTLVFGETALTVFRDIGQDDRDASLMARDAFSGMPMWHREDLAPQTRFAIVMDEKRVILHPEKRGWLEPHAIALDRLTGETIQTFDQGFDFTVTKEMMQEDRRSMQYAQARAEDLQFRLLDGVLVQTIREEVIVLDAETGERKWSRKAAEGKGFVHPTAGDGTLFLVEGEYTRHSSYTHWPMSKPERIYAFDLASGEEKWVVDWDEKRFGATHGIYNLQLENSKLAGAVTIQHPPDDKGRKQKPQPHGLILNAKDGSLVYWGREEDAWPGNTGAGHSHVRMHLRGDTAWTAVIGEPIAFWKIDDAANFTSFKGLYTGRDAKFESGMRPVSCTVWRSTPNWWFGGVNCYPILGDGEGYFNRSGRSNCDIGSFPANGLLYSPPNTCQCQVYLPGTKAYHSRHPIAPIADETRLERGTAEPSPARGDGKAGWPQWRRDTARRGWLDQQLPTNLEVIWERKFETGELPGLLAKQWNVDGVARGPITQAAAAEGILAVAESHRQAILGLDPETGETLWRTPVDGRVDSMPSIFRGLVYAGTRNGWVYALARDTGEIVWRFFAAPADDRLAVNGQLESYWPVFGSVPVDEFGVMVVAGRHTACDGGLWWWQLDPATGEIKANGQLGNKNASRFAANWPRKLPIELRPIQNSVPVMNEGWFLLPGANLTRVDGAIGELEEETRRPSVVSFVEDDDFAKQQRRGGMVRFGRNALLGEKSQNVGGWRKPYFAHTLARIFSIRGDEEFVSVGGGLYTAGGRGGGGDSKVHRMRWLDEMTGEKQNEQRIADQIWEHRDGLLESRGLPSISAMAVCDNAIFLGASIYISGRRGEEEREKMAHRLRILDLETGELIRDLPVPDRVLQGGISLADGRIFVACEDGGLVCYGEK